MGKTSGFSLFVDKDMAESITVSLNMARMFLENNSYRIGPGDRKEIKKALLFAELVNDQIHKAGFCEDKNCNYKVKE